MNNVKNGIFSKARTLEVDEIELPINFGLGTGSWSVVILDLNLKLYEMGVDRKYWWLSSKVVREPGKKSVPSGSTKRNLFYIDCHHIQLTKMHDGLFNYTA